VAAVDEDVVEVVADEGFVGGVHYDEDSDSEDGADYGDDEGAGLVGRASISSLVEPIASIHLFAISNGENQSSPNAWPATTATIMAM
jgi:hypothetical protein